MSNYNKTVLSLTEYKGSKEANAFKGLSTLRQETKELKKPQELDPYFEKYLSNESEKPKEKKRKVKLSKGTIKVLDEDKLGFEQIERTSLKTKYLYKGDEEEDDENCKKLSRMTIWTFACLSCYWQSPFIIFIFASNELVTFILLI
mmetsp:Transcript_23160/g.41017  ORF Transcript_23160/g.41017 Transcript_23160/m.41017 type:complete len:146 (-) Transcript_23160:2640-3077(-)